MRNDSPIKKRGSYIFSLALYRNCDFAPIFWLCEFTPLFLKRSTTLPIFRHTPLTVLHFIQKDRNAHVILPLFVMPICDFASDLRIRHLYLIKYIWGSCIFTLALYRNCDFTPVFWICEFTPFFLKRSTTLLLFRHPPLTVLYFIQKDRNVHVILPLFVMPIYDFAPDLGIRHLYLIKYKS